MRRAGLCRAIFQVVAFTLFCLSAAGLWAQQPDASTPEAGKLPSFEVASIKPTKVGFGDHDWDSNVDRISIEGYSLRDLITYAYGLKSNSQVIGGPEWLDKKRFDIAAKMDAAEWAKVETMSRADEHVAWEEMMQSLLAERFGLKVSHGQQTIPVLTLVLAGHAQKLVPSAKDAGHNFSARNSHVTAKATSMTYLADFLTGQQETEERVVVDRTGLEGGFDFTLDWTRDRGKGVPPDAPYPGLLNALHEQLGLELKSGKAAVDVVTVDAARMPEFD